METKKKAKNKTSNKYLSDKILHTKKELIAAMRKTLCNVTQSCNKVGVSRQTHYEYMNTDVWYSKEINLLSEESTDYVESMMYRRIGEGSDNLIKFYLTCKAKDRGYVDKQEIEHSGSITRNVFKIGDQEIEF